MKKVGILSFEFSKNGKTYSKFGALIMTAKVESAHVALIYTGKSANPSVRFDWLRVTPQNGK
ncbi:hypothetical protein IC235_00035 [Hymenobacter sp. BT664]|uniref:Uncharacterized protein n=1 Tax=Hymenobacter montanus TaxID=2771359 RepID=A0A927B9Z5_9BACT|nr:hypothetical protein [Hymenobacter montanus]MBD2766278.1 hypothetical protein [Hymenobacter montanus]